MAASICRTVSRVSASLAGLSVRHRSIRGNRTARPDLCRGDIAQVVDTLNRFPIGSCVFGDFVPYVTPGSG